MIQFNQVSKIFQGKPAVDDLTLRIAKGEFAVLIGTSGSGKSTTLKMINRLIEHDQGKIYFADEEIQKFKPQDLRRRMGYAIQSIGLFPHWTVEENIATVPQLLKWPRAHSRSGDRIVGAVAPGAGSVPPPLSTPAFWRAAAAGWGGACVGRRP